MSTANHRTCSRRSLLCSGVATAGILALPPSITLLAAEGDKEKQEEQVSPAEDLMREHGVLKRVMLVYDELAHRLDANADFPPQALTDSAQIIRTFIEDYHEKLEEDYVFPRFHKANTLVDLVTTLQQQHDSGRKLTALLLQHAGPQLPQDQADRKQLAAWMRSFNRMYAPHEAREDTVLFPAFRKLVSPNEYDALGEDFEKQEHKQFGEDGFEKMVDRVAEIEKSLDIYDLSRFTPNV